ncbi:MAG: PAS domain-containing protein [Dehalococcoidia bacterium]|jgi:PAS domain S-box-containing protein/putative nucleotidyltransferase with HDIG domain
MSRSKLNNKKKQEPVKDQEHYRQLMDHISSGVVVYEAVRAGEDFIIKDINRAAEKIEKISKDAVMGKSVLEVFPGIREFGLFDVFQRVWQTGKSERHAISLYRDERVSGWKENYVYKSPAGDVVAVYDDITVSKGLQEKLRASEEAKQLADLKYRAMLDEMNESYFELDPSGNFTFFNDSLCRYLGYAREELQGMNYKTYTPKEEWHDVVQTSVDAFTTGKPTVSRLLTNIRKDGQRIYVEHSIFPLKNEEGQIIGLRGLGRDVTERVVAENQIVRSKNLLQSVLDADPDWIYVMDDQHRFLLVNRAFSTALGFEPQNMIGKIDTEFFPKELCLGNPAKGIKGFHAEDDDVLRGREVRRSGDVLKWKNGTSHIYDTLKVPLRDHSGAIYSVLVYGHDVTEQRRYEKELKGSYDNLQKAFVGAVDALAATSEKRDPYTAGHQRRVSQLAVAIAIKMRLPIMQVEGVKVAALIHDIGKIGVPSDILSKPGRLSNVEYSIVRTHSEVAFDILQSIDFPWPIATIVLQHHERMNGTGYPHGIPGERITIEARIIAVADVVEAMASHRPYRPSAGIEAALKEITDNKGVLYDISAVEACLELFQEGFHFA